MSRQEYSNSYDDLEALVAELKKIITKYREMPILCDNETAIDCCFDARADDLLSALHNLIYGTPNDV
jgi:hypothetical protein